MQTVVVDWGLISFEDAWNMQTTCFDDVVRSKKENIPYINRIICCEHTPVYTLGRSGKENNMLISEEHLKALGATVHRIDRGGDITYHGPGQLVCYPIINLEEFALGLREYVHLLEEAVIRVCDSYGIVTTRLEKATGVWIDPDQSTARKICAIGVRCSRYVTMHGLALNVNTDLNYFNYVNPCGFRDKGVTSLQRELGREIPLEEVKEKLSQEIICLLGVAASDRG